MSDDDNNVIQFPQLSKIEKALDRIENPDEPITKREALLIAWHVNEEIRKDVQKSLDGLATQLNAAFKSIDSRIARLEAKTIDPSQP